MSVLSMETNGTPQETTWNRSIALHRFGTPADELAERKLAESELAAISIGETGPEKQEMK